MKKLLTLFLLSLFLCSCNTQSVNNNSTETALDRFPGFTATQIKVLLQAKDYYSIPLPTWLPEGFKVEQVVAKVGPNIKTDDQVLEITYSKKLSTDKKQTFVISAGMEGIGDMVYDGSQIVRSSLGNIDLYYLPKDGDSIVHDYVRTEWFLCDSTNFDYSSCGFMTKDPKSFVMISLSDTKKIIGSLQKL